MERSKPAYDRIALKYQLMDTRSVFVPKVGMRPVCAVCGLPIIESPDMHEALVSKQRGRHLPPEVLNCRGNCVLTHPGGKSGVCHALAHTDEGYTKCALHIVKWDGIIVPIQFLVKVRDLSKTKDIEPAMRFASVMIENGMSAADVGYNFLSAGW